MTYIVQASEKVRGIGADYETKAMLYLMNFHPDSQEISYFAIDFFNDVTGLNSYADKAWDVQSKGTKGSGPKDIGRELVTLFKNYVSELNFDCLILFLATAPPSLRKDNTIITFGIENITERALKSLKTGLIEEANEKEYIDNTQITETNIDAFLKRVIFVVDNKTKADYIRNTVKFSQKYIPEDNVLDGIFNTIRDKQASKKNNSSVEGVSVEHHRDVFCYDRIIGVREIQLLVINKIINHDLMGNGIPVYFIPVIHNYDALRQKDVVEDCQLKLSTLLYDKSQTEDFWTLMDIIATAVEKYKSLGVIDTYTKIEHNRAVHNPRLDIMAIYYLIAVMKEALP